MTDFVFYRTVDASVRSDRVQLREFWERARADAGRIRDEYDRVQEDAYALRYVVAVGDHSTRESEQPPSRQVAREG